MTTTASAPETVEQLQGGLLVDPPTLGEQPGGFDSRAVMRHFGPALDPDTREIIRRHYAPAQRLFNRSVAVGGAVPVLAVEKNPRRIGAALNNVSLAVTVYFGDRGDVVVGQLGEEGAGFPIPPGGLFTFGKEYVGPLWLVASAAAEVRVLELMTF